MIIYWQEQDLKVRKVVEVKSQYSFEAPVIPAVIKANAINGARELSLLDLNDYLVPKPSNIYLVRVSGESMIDENIYDGDLLLVDRTEKPADGKVVIAALNGEMAVKIFRIIKGKIYLVSANKKFIPIKIEPYMEFQIQGIVKHVIHNM